MRLERGLNHLAKVGHKRYSACGSKGSFKEGVESKMMKRTLTSASPTSTPYFSDITSMSNIRSVARLEQLFWEALKNNQMSN